MTDENGGSVPIDLAHEADFALGALIVRPSTREALRGALREQLEPRVMQVLVALAQAGGRVVSRDDLITRCWEGRVVGEDAINRAIGRLRRLSETDKGASFEIETIPRVGFRLTQAHTVNGGAANVGQPDTPHRRTRRWWVAGTAVVPVLAAGGWYVSRVMMTPPHPAALPEAAQEQLGHGVQLLRHSTVSDATEAVGVFSNLTVQYPELADGWGGLALSYALLSHGVRNAGDAMRLRSNAAADRAFSLDPHNAMAFEARGWSMPRRGAWLTSERYFRLGLQYHPRHDGLLLGLAFKLADVGRNHEAADLVRRAIDNSLEFDPALAWNGIQIFWAANRLAEADQLAERSRQLFPGNTQAWFWRVYLLMFTGRSDAAIAILNDTDNRPAGIPDNNFTIEIAAAQAMQSGRSDDAAKAEDTLMASAHQGGGYAENAIMMLSALNKVDATFKVANAYFFGQGFQVGEHRFSVTQGGYSARSEARTVELFSPAAKAIRADARFAALVDDLGLAKYWKDASVVPDYQVG